jgi:uncharacterized protein (TIGR00255 family)
MTGFARMERQFDFGRLSWELRSVNHRFLEITLRLPEEFRACEPAMREALAQHLSRGKIDGTLRFKAGADGGAGEIQLNDTLAARLLTLHGEVRELVGIEQAPDITAILRWPGVVEEVAADPGPLQQAALELLEQTTAELCAARIREGQAIADALNQRLEGVARWAADIRTWLPDIRASLKQRLLERIADLPQPLEPGRLEQEIVLQAQKMDVDEELDRLDAHVDEARRALQLDEPVGRRLDFLMQEFNRESNTLSSKSVDVRTSQASVELKVLIEQMREQIQNVE